MRHMTWMIGMGLFLATLVGCGDKNEGSHATTAAAGSSASDLQGDSQQGVVADTGTPEKAVAKFLDALRLGDEKLAAALLTAKARAETAAHDMVVEPPGAPNATYTVGPVEHPEGDVNAAYVSCIWSEKYDNGEEESYEVVWVLRKEQAGWRVAGMATQLSEMDEPVFLDFEDLAAMENMVRDAEAATQHGPSASQNPSPGGVLR
jgi:hypothetical protein